MEMTIAALIFGALFVLSDYIGENTNLKNNSVYGVVKSVLGVIASGLKK